MNQTIPQVLSDSGTPFISSENYYQPSHTSLYESQNNDILAISSPVQVAERSPLNENAHYMNHDAQYSSTPQQAVFINQIHPAEFFYRPPNDSYHYYVNCKEISYETIEGLLRKLFNNDKENVMQFKENEYIFFYLQKCNNRFYQVSCEIVSPLLISNCLTKSFLGIELQQNIDQEYLEFTLNQQVHLEYHLKQYLSQYLLN